MLKFKETVCVLTLVAMASPAFSATINSVASLANPLDNNGGGARALAMGSAFVAVADDSVALLWNPAGLSGLKTPEVALHHNSWLGGIVQETLVFGMPVGRLGGLAASANYVNYGTLEAYDETGTRLADYSANRYGFGLGLGKEFMKDLSGGIAVRGAMQKIDTDTYTSVGLDLGAQWLPMKHVRLGLSYSNLGTSVVGYALASTLRAGASYSMAAGTNNDLLFSAGAAWEPQGVSRLQVGAEDVLFQLLALRLGYQGNLSDNQLGGLNGMTAGLGVTAQGLSLDYAYLPYGDLGAGHRISLGYRFN